MNVSTPALAPADVASNAPQDAEQKEPISVPAESEMLLRVYQLSAAMCLLVLLVLLPFFITRKLVPGIGAAIGLAAALAGIAMLRRGLARQSMWLMVIAVWLASALMTVGGLPHVMMPLVLATTVVVAMVIGGRVAGAFGASFLIFWLLVRIVTDMGLITPVLYERHWITWIMSGASFVMIMLPILALAAATTMAGPQQLS